MTKERKEIDAKSCQKMLFHCFHTREMYATDVSTAKESDDNWHSKSLVDLFIKLGKKCNFLFYFIPFFD